MQLKLVAVISAVLASVSADEIRFRGVCYPGRECELTTRWITCCGEYFIDRYMGCGKPPVPNVNDFCLDNQNARGHFFATGQNKRCLAFSYYNDCKSSMPGADYCYEGVWTEVPCTWRVADEKLKTWRLLMDGDAKATVEAVAFKA